MFIIRDREAGNCIDKFDTLDEAIEALYYYEEDDRANNNYTKDFYEIIEERR